MTPRRAVPLLGLLGLVLTGCGGADVSGLEVDRARVDLSLSDASVPPDSHRSWELLLDAERTVSTVTDYEEVLDEGSAPTSADELGRLLDDLSGLLDNAEAAGTEDCAGGTSLTVIVSEGEPGEVSRADAEELRRVEVDTCTDEGSAAQAALLEAVTPFAETVGLPEQARTWPS